MGASEENDLKKVEDRLEREVDDLQRHGEEVGKQIDTAREDWQRKRNDPSVPGAVPEDRGDEDADAESAVS